MVVVSALAGHACVVVWWAVVTIVHTTLHTREEKSQAGSGGEGAVQSSLEPCRLSVECVATCPAGLSQCDKSVNVWK